MSEMNRETQSWAPRSTSVLLFVASLAVLHAGGFIQFDDTSGFGSDRWNMPLGFVALLLALASVAVAVSDRTARRAVGTSLAILDVLLVGASITDEGFRFVWDGNEGELFYLQVALGLAALILWASTSKPPKERSDGSPDRAFSSWFRGAIHAAVVVIAMLVTFNVGTAHFESTQCSGPNFDGECDLAFLEGFAWAGATFFLMVIGFGASGLLRARKLRR